MTDNMTRCRNSITSCEHRRHAYLSTKLVTGRFFMERMLPETSVHLARIQSGAATTMELAAEAF